MASSVMAGFVWRYLHNHAAKVENNVAGYQTRSHFSRRLPLSLLMSSNQLPCQAAFGAPPPVASNWLFV